MRKLFILVLFSPSFLYAQDKGIRFEHGLSLQQVLAKAKAENKYIFMDCFTTWCGPCRYMTTSIFPLQNVGDSVNAHFISVAVQLDTTARDNDEVKSWYQSAHDIAQQYHVQVYPTYLVFNSNGKILHRFVGASDALSFLNKVAKALNPETQFYVLLDKYKAGKKDTAFLRSFALSAADAYDMQAASIVANEYIAAQTNLFTKDNLEFISRFTQSSKDKGFDIMLNHGDKVNAIVGEGSAEKLVRDIIFKEEIYPVIFTTAPSQKTWDSLQKAVAKKYPSRVKEVLMYSKVVFYQGSGDWENFAPAIVAYMKLYGDKESDNQLNQFAWTVFQNCSDMTCVAEALEWSKRSFARQQNPAYLDTYANILYKMGRKEEAIQWEEKAMNLATGDKKSFEQTLEKMKKGEKTWN